MGETQALPLPQTAFPVALWRFVDPAAPAAARLMAAKGLLPVKGSDLVAVLLQLAADVEAAIATAASEALQKLPKAPLQAAASADLGTALLNALVPHVQQHRDVLELLVGNAALEDAALAGIAKTGDEALTEMIAANEQRLLQAPQVIEALYHNPRTRMSTAERLIELAARHGLQLQGIASFEAHVEAIRDQSIAPVSTDRQQADSLFFQALAADSDDSEAVERDPADGSESVKEQFQPLQFRIRDMSLSQKIRLATLGNAAARALLVRDNNKLVAMAAIGSPRTTDSDAAGIANSREVSEDVLRYIANKREWLGNYEVKRALVFNSKTPVGLSMKFLVHLREQDLRAIGRSRNVPAAVKNAAAQKLQQRKG